MSTVTIEHVTKLFGSLRALDDVSLEIGQGELVALLGGSGCGKTTLLRSVAGLEHPEFGRIRFDGADMTSVPTRQRPIGMVFQSYALFPNMTVRQNIGFPLTIRRNSQAQIDARVDELLTLVQLTDRADRFPNQLSGGQQQRASLARALAPSPQVLLLDEPLSALDALVRLRLRDEIRRIQQAVDITAIYVTHDQSEAMAIADRVAVMNKGHIEQIARPADLYETPTTRFSATFIGNRNAIELPVANGRVRFGQAIDAPAPEGASSALVFFRPEDIEFNSNGHGQPALIETKIFQGLLTRLYLRIDEAGQTLNLYADLPSRQAAHLDVGSAVRISVDPAYTKVFPSEGVSA